MTAFTTIYAAIIGASAALVTVLLWDALAARDPRPDDQPAPAPYARWLDDDQEDK